MDWHKLIPFAPLLVMLGLAAATDLRNRRIPNSLTLLIALTGLLQCFTASGTVRPLDSFLGFMAGFALTFALFALGALGGGDVKLVAAAGTWLGHVMVFQTFLAAAIIGMVIVLAQCAVQGRLRILLRNSVLLLMNLLHVRELGAAHVEATGNSCRSVSKPLPYAVPVLLGTVLLLIVGRFFA